VKPALVLLAWALLLGVHTTVLVLLGGTTQEVAMLGGAAAGCALLSGVVAVWRGRGRAVVDLSLPTMLAAIAVAGLVVGSEVGTWLLLISGGLLLLAAAGLVREERAR
jgi:hypothetical protein